MQFLHADIKQDTQLEHNEGNVNEKHVQLRANLEKAITSQEVNKLEPAISEVKKEGVPENCTELLKKVLIKVCAHLKSSVIMFNRLHVHIG